MTTNSVWVVISCDAAVDKLRDLIDKGYFAESQSIVYELKAICDKVQKLVEAKGGSLLLNAYERIVFEVPITVAEEMPNIVEGYKQFFGTKIACGIGLTFTEASSAAKKSTYSNNIELFDPKDPSFHEGSAFYKSYDDIEYNLPPNLFDPKSPPNDPQAPQLDEYVGVPSADQQLQAENQMIQAVVAQIGGQQIQQMQQQMQEAQQGAAGGGGDQGPRDLMEALHGEQIPGHEKDLNENEGGNPEGATQEDENEGGESKESKGSSKEKDEGEEGDEDDEDHNAKLGQLLATVKQHVPQIMQLADSNPAAYRQAINMVNKLLEYSKKSKKKTKKSDLFALTDELNKALKLHLPVGTIRGKKKKVMVDGKEVWRSVSAGQVEDVKGNAISVRVANSQTKQNGKN